MSRSWDSARRILLPSAGQTRRLAHGFRNFNNYRLRILLAAGGHKPWRTTATPAS
ncbi:MAG: hypothetical protein WBL06_08700 [Pseudolysinimonas sp.]|uniref:hypothetical protein n=1 Tax=Pseudolysinimonas sp. TaxID=2680009 RepID=UPI003C71C2C9